MRAISLLCVLFLLLGTVAFAGEPLVAGVSRVNLTPPLDWKFPLGGYGARMNKPAEGVHDWIWAKGLVLQQGHRRFALVTLDIVGLPPNIKPEVLDKLGEGWNEKNLMLLASHSHGSLNMSSINTKNVLGLPQIGIFHQKVHDWVVEKIVEAVRQAERDLRPVAVGTASAELHGLNHNRRGDGVTDPELTVTRIDLASGKPLAVLVNWTAHPTFVDEHDMLVTGCWPGVLQRELEAWIGNGVTAFYYNGAEGDQSPSGAVGGSHFEKLEDYGRKIAIQARALYDNIQPKENASLEMNYAVAPLPERQPHPQFMQTGGAEYGLDEHKMQVLLSTMVPENVGVQAVRIGDLLIAGVPGEMIASLGLQVKKALREAGAPHPVIGGLANEWISYILSESEYKQGGYEASVSFYGPKLGETMVKAVLDVARPLAGR